MANLHDLKKSIILMTDEEAMDLILLRRESRLIAKQSSKKSIAPKKNTISKKLEGMSAKQMLGAMSDKDKQELMNLLKGA